MGALILFIFSSFLQADTACSGLFFKEEITQKAEKSFDSYFQQRSQNVSENSVNPPKYVKFSHRIKKSEHPYSLYKNGLVQLVYLYLYTKTENKSLEYLNRIDDALGEYQHFTSNVYRQYLSYEVKRQQLEIIKKSIKDNKTLELYMPKIDSNLQVVLEQKKYPDKETLKLHLDQLVVEISHLSKDQVYKKIKTIEKKQAETYLSLIEIQKIIKKHLYVYSPEPSVVKKAEALKEIIEPIANINKLSPTRDSLKQFYRKMFFDNIGYIVRGHKYNEETQELNIKLENSLPQEHNAQFGQKTMFEAFKINSRMNILKRITGRVIDRSYFQNMFRFKFMGWSVLAVSLWLTNPVEFIQNYNFGQSLARFELKWFDSRYVNKMKSLEDEKFIDVASDIYLIMSKDYFKDVDGQTRFIKDPKSDVSPVETILKAIEKRSEHQKQEAEYRQKKQIALYHTLQTVKLDSLTKLAFVSGEKNLRQELNNFLQSEYQASTKLPSQVMLTQWLNFKRSNRPDINFDFTPVSKDKIVETLERSLEINFDQKTTNDLHQIINSYSAEKQQQLINSSIWRDLETVYLIRQSYFDEYLKAKDKKAFRFQLIEDLAYELTSSEFRFKSN
ncbi:MAG: hypothetical protein MK008_05215 [Bdellovibrionales bacterium]|nr:hypothetical protein [Bdellovibrionales bacterium]